jgi:hypothetical protein
LGVVTGLGFIKRLLSRFRPSDRFYTYGPHIIIPLLLVLVVIGLYALFTPFMNQAPSLASCQTVTGKLESLAVAGSIPGSNKGDIAFKLEGQPAQYMVRVSKEIVERESNAIKNGDTVTVWVAPNSTTVWQMQKDQSFIVAYDEMVNFKNQGNGIYYVVGAFCILLGLGYGADYVLNRKSRLQEMATPKKRKASKR